MTCFSHPPEESQIRRQSLSKFVLFLAGGEIQWDYIHGLFEQAVYGGRVDNAIDNDVLRSYLTQYFNNGMIGSGKGLRTKTGLNLTLPSSTDLKVT